MEYSLLLKSHDEEKSRKLIDERYSLTGSQKPFLVLHEGAGDKAPPLSSHRRPKSHRNSRKSQASAALARFRKNGKPQYNLYLPLHHQWSAYIANVGTSGESLLSADWHGSLITIKTSKNPSYVGLKGILLWESRTQFLLVSLDNRFKIVPKQGTVAVLSNENKEINFTVVGDRVLCRSTERTTRKFKPHDVADLAPLLKYHFA